MGIHLVVPFLLVALLTSPASVSSTRGKSGSDCIEAITSGTREQAIAKADDYIQREISNVKSYLTANYEPLFLEKLDDLESLKVQGLSSAELIGSPNLILSGNILMHEFKMVFKHLKAEADLNKQVWGPITVTGRLHATIDGMELYAKLRFDLKGGVRATLDQVIVTEWGTVTAKIVRGNWLDSLPNLTADIIVDHVKQDTPKIIETVFAKVLHEHKVACPPSLR